MRFHILGLGSIGTLIAHHLRLANPKAPISLLVRDSNRPRIARLLRARDEYHNTLVVTRDDRTIISRGFDLGFSGPRGSKFLEDIKKSHDQSNSFPKDFNDNIDSLIVCLKAPATIDALSILKTRLKPTSVITLFQNGMGVYDELCAKLWPDPASRPQFILGTITHGVSRTKAPGTILHMSKLGHGDIRMGIMPDPRSQFDVESWLWGRKVGNLPLLTPPDSPEPPLPSSPSPSADNLRMTLSALLEMKELSPSLLPMPHLYQQLLRKLALNSIINPLTALIGGGYLPNDILSTHSIPGNRLISQIAGEISAVLTPYVNSISPSGNAPMDVINLFSKSNLERSVVSLAAGTANNISSMASDVKNGIETEIDYINGMIVELGRQMGVDTPVNSMLRQLIKFRTEVNGLRKAATSSELRSALKDGEKTAVEEKRLSRERQKMSIRERELRLHEQSMGLNVMKNLEKLRAARAARRQLKKSREAEMGGLRSNEERSHL